MNRVFLLIAVAASWGSYFLAFVSIATGLFLLSSALAL